MMVSQSIADIGGYNVGVSVADTIQATHVFDPDKNSMFWGDELIERSFQNVR